MLINRDVIVSDFFVRIGQLLSKWLPLPFTFICFSLKSNKTATSTSFSGWMAGTPDAWCPHDWIRFCASDSLLGWYRFNGYSSGEEIIFAHIQPVDASDVKVRILLIGCCEIKLWYIGFFFKNKSSMQLLDQDLYSCAISYTTKQKLISRQEN